MMNQNQFFLLGDNNSVYPAL